MRPSGWQTDVASSDQHTVRPWFHGRLDFSPRVQDLSAEGFTLVGGRLDYVHKRSVIALVYQRRKHTINVLIWPSASSEDEKPRSLTHQTYNLVHASWGGMTRWAVSDLNARELRELLDSGKNLALIDVREPVEWDINHIDGAQLIPKSLITSGEGLAQLPHDRRAVLYCKTGVRSAEALAAVKKAGFSDAVHLQGGIVAWAKQMQPDMVMY